MYIEYCYGPKWPYLIYIAYIGLFGTGICRFVQVLYLGRAPRTKETLPDFREKCRVTRHSRVFRRLTGSQRTLGFWGVTELISKLPSPTNVKIVRQFLGHAGFYRRFIKDFSKIAKPLYKLLEKDDKFVWENECQESFEELKSHLTTTPIVRAPNWLLPFEVMCAANDLAIVAVLGQREDGKPHVVYYASKTLNEAQRNYTTI